MRRVLLAAAISFALVTARAQAQTVNLYLDGDSAIVLVPGDSALAHLEVTTSGGLGSYSVTLRFDDNRIRLMRADANPFSTFAAPTVVTGADQVTLSSGGPGNGFTGQNVADLWFQLAPGAVEGSFVSITVNALLDQAGSSLLPSHRAGFSESCYGPTYWGDVTGEQVINSRDALVTLTRAVGKSTAGYDTRPGDVDEDGDVTSRDALAILSHGINLPVFSTRTGYAMATRCAPQVPSPQDLVLYRNSTVYRLVAGDTIASPLSFAAGEGGLDINHRAVLSPDGSRLLVGSYDLTGFSDMLSVTIPGGVVTKLVQDPAQDVAGDWSPDGAEIAWVSRRVSPAAIFRMPATGGAAVRVTPAQVEVASDLLADIAWSADGTRIAFAGCANSCGNQGIWVVNLDGTGLTEVLLSVYGHLPKNISWSAGGDSIIYYNYFEQQTYVVPAGGEIVPPAVLDHTIGGQAYLTISDFGYAFQNFYNYPYSLMSRRASDGRLFRMLRNPEGQDYYYSYRRRPGVYVSTVTVTPAGPHNIPLSGVVGLTASVTNSDAATNSTVPIAWITRDPGVVSVSATGTRTADAAGVANGSTYVVATVLGWRSDSVLVTVP